MPLSFSSHTTHALGTCCVFCLQSMFPSLIYPTDSYFPSKLRSCLFICDSYLEPTSWVFSLSFHVIVAAFTYIQYDICHTTLQLFCLYICSFLDCELLEPRNLVCLVHGYILNISKNAKYIMGAQLNLLMDA